MSDDQSAPEKRSWMKMGCLGLLGLFVLFSVIGALAPEPTPEELAEREAERAASEAAEAAERQANAQTEVESALAVSSRDLAAAYDANEVRAQQTYGDRKLLVSGTVTGITLDFMDEPVVQLNGVNQFLDVQADLNDKQAAASLNRGQQVRLLCGSITEVISAPMLSDCEIVD